MFVNKKVQYRLLERNIRYSTMDGMFFCVMMGAAIPYLGAYIRWFNGPPELVNLITAFQPIITCVFTLLGTEYANSFQKKKTLLMPPSVAVRLFVLLIAFIPFLPPHLVVTLPWKAMTIELRALAFFIMWGLMYIPWAYCGLTWSPMMCNIVPEERRNRFFGTRNALTGATSLLGTFLAGIALDRFSFLPAFTGIFGISFLCTAISFYYLAKQVEPIDWEPGENKKQVRTGNARLFQLDLHGCLQPFRDPEYGQIFTFCCLALFVFHIGFSMAIPLFTLRQIDQLHFAKTAVSMIATLSGLTALAGSYAAGYVSSRWGFRYVLLFSTILALVPPVVWAFTTDSFWLTAASMLWGFTGNAYMVCFLFMVLQVSPFVNRSRFVGMNTVIGNLAGALGPLSGMFLVKIPALNIQGSLICSALIMLAGVVLSYILVRRTSI